MSYTIKQKRFNATLAKYITKLEDMVRNVKSGNIAGFDTEFLSQVEARLSGYYRWLNNSYINGISINKIKSASRAIKTSAYDYFSKSHFEDLGSLDTSLYSGEFYINIPNGFDGKKTFVIVSDDKKISHFIQNTTEEQCSIKVYKLSDRIKIVYKNYTLDKMYVRIMGWR